MPTIVLDFGIQQHGLAEWTSDWVQSMSIIRKCCQRSVSIHIYSYFVYDWAFTLWQWPHQQCLQATADVPVGSIDMRRQMARSSLNQPNPKHTPPFDGWDERGTHTIIACSSLLNFISIFASLSCTQPHAHDSFFSRRSCLSVVQPVSYATQCDKRGARCFLLRLLHSWYMFSQLFRI